VRGDGDFRENLRNGNSEKIDGRSEDSDQRRKSQRWRVVGGGKLKLKGDKGKFEGDLLSAAREKS